MRGLALLNSLERHSADFQLIVYCFDQASHALLIGLGRPNLVPLLMEAIEDDELVRVKKARSIVEYFWTCTPIIILDAIRRFHLDSCTYLDSDLFIFSDPERIFKEIGDSSVGITPHGYSEKYQGLRSSGIYNVQFVFFRNSASGMKALEWWRNACLEWCFARVEDGKFGDQLYLDDWPERFEGVHVVSDHGSFLGPWNIQRFELNTDSDGVWAHEGTDAVRVVSYHFHSMQIVGEKRVLASHFELSQDALQFLYQPYIAEIGTCLETIRSVEKFWSYGMELTFTPREFYRASIEYCAGIRSDIVPVEAGKNPWEGTGPFMLRCFARAKLHQTLALFGRASRGMRRRANALLNAGKN